MTPMPASFSQSTSKLEAKCRFQALVGFPQGAAGTKTLELGLYSAVLISSFTCLFFCVARFEVWPGFIASIVNKESGMMLMVDATHRFLRTDTVLDWMNDLWCKCRGNFHRKCSSQLVGKTVLTRYNSKRYRVDDIAWDQNPRSSFTLRDGSEITFAQYYHQVGYSHGHK